MRSPREEPQGLVYRPELITPAEERGLLRILEPMSFDPVMFHGQAARRTALHFGLDYDYGARVPRPGAPIPEWLLPLRARAAEFAKCTPDALAEILVQRYPSGSTMGWHRDAPAFDVVIGISLLGFCRLRFQRGLAEERRVWEVGLEPRSGYILSGSARESWQHSIPALKELRYSITFRTMRDGASATSMSA